MPAAASAPVWAPQEPGVQQICYLLSEYQKPGTNQSQVRHLFTDVNIYLNSVHACNVTHTTSGPSRPSRLTLHVYSFELSLPLQILAQLEECKNIPDFNNYLAFILSQGNSLPVEVSSLVDHTAVLTDLHPAFSAAVMHFLTNL